SSRRGPDKPAACSSRATNRPGSARKQRGGHGEVDRMAVVLIPLDDIQSFREVRAYPASNISPELIDAVQKLDEREELEPFLRSILTDVGNTPHGPAEIVDILTHKLVYRGTPTLSAFILKGRSFQTVRPKDISHQIYRLEKIDGLGIAVLAYTGTILD